jgi:inner membrane protein
VNEVSSKWANNQTIAGPYIVIPYNDTSTTTDGKLIVVKKDMVVLANDLIIDGKLFPEERPRSIYKVLLYKSDSKLSGTFKPQMARRNQYILLDFANAIYALVSVILKESRRKFILISIIKTLL